MPVLGTLQAECGVATPVADIGAAVFFCANSHFYNVLRYCILSAAVSELARGLGGACNASGRDAFRPITTVKFRTRTRMDSKEKKKKMTKTHKAVLSTLAVPCLLFMGSGVAQAQECFAFPITANTVRAEGITEAVGSIQLQCRAKTGFGLPDLPAESVISITLNTQITNATSSDGDTVTGLTYDLGDPGLGMADTDYMGEGKEVLSDDGTTITWTIPTGDGVAGGITFSRLDAGETVTIGGIIANAYMVGDGNDVTAEVRVNGVVIDHSPLKLADVTTGLDIKVTAATGLQCDPSEATATIMFTEGFSSAIRAVANDPAMPLVDESAGNSVLVLNFRGIPDGVTVMASLMGTGVAMEADGTDLAPLKLETGSTEGADADGIVSLSSAGAGEVMYTFDTGLLVDLGGDDDDPANGVFDDGDIRHIDDTKKEWNDVTITFTWEAGAPPLDMGSVTVSYHPVTDDVTRRPRYVAGPSNDVITIEDCTTTLLFPFVTNQLGFNTGLAITNASEGSGSCTIEYRGKDAPDDLVTPGDLAGEEQWVGLLSTIAPEFQGYITASCEFRDAHGYAFITGPGDNLAQGYLAVCTNCDD